MGREMALLVTGTGRLMMPGLTSTLFPGYFGFNTQVSRGPDSRRCDAGEARSSVFIRDQEDRSHQTDGAGQRSQN